MASEDATNDAADRSRFGEIDIPEHRDEEAVYEGVHERGDRRIVRRFQVGEEEISVHAIYFLDGSRLGGVGEGAVDVEEAERRDGDVESFCRRWHERDVVGQLGEDFDAVLEQNRDKAWVKHHLETP